MAETVRIAPEAHATLVEISQEMHLPLTEVLTKAVRAYKRELFLRGVAADFAALTPEELAEEHADVAAWDATLADGLKDE